MLTTRSQRWRARRSVFVDDLTVIDPRLYAVDVIEAHSARRFIAEHHYLPSYPAARLAAGLFGPGKGGASSLVGVAVFGVPTTGAVVTKHSGMAENQACCLSRLILTDEVAANGESFATSRALRLLRREKPAMEAVVSYSDPLHGHIGQVYCALSAAYRGQGRPRTSYSVAGQDINGRTLSKVRLGERGSAAAVDRIVALGAPRPGIGEDLPSWIERLHRERILLRKQHPGLHAYSFPLTRRARARGRRLPTEPYPTLASLTSPQLPLGI